MHPRGNEDERIYYYYGPLNRSVSVVQPCCRAITYAMVWLPLPTREIPIMVPSSSAMLWYLDSVPVMTALQ